MVDVLVSNQKVLMKWNGNNKEYYEAKGYTYTKVNELFELDISDLSPHAKISVNYICDFCGNTFERNMSAYRPRDNHYCSNECKERFRNPNGLTNQERLDQSIEGIIILQNKLNKTPTVLEYDKYAKENGLFLRRVIQAKTNKNWNELCEELFSKVNIIKKDKEVLLLELKKLKEKLGRTPMTNELVSNGLADFKVYMRKFNMTFSELISTLGWETNGNFTTEVRVSDLYDKYNTLYKKLGRIPLWNDIRNEPNYPSDRTFATKCGSIEDICKYLNIPIVNSELNSLGYGFTLIDDKGSICRSHPEMVISNLLILNNLKYEKEVKYKEIIPSEKSKKVMDWYLLSFNVCVEYFGLFIENPQGVVLKKYHKKTLEKISLCKSNNVPLIDLYKEDLENNFEGLIKKFAQNNINISNTQYKQEVI